MPLTLAHKEFKKILDDVTGLKTWSVYIPARATYPASCYSQTELTRSPQSSLGATSLSIAAFSVFIVSPDFDETHQLTQNLIDELDMKATGNIAQIRVENVNDDYDPTKDLFIKGITVTLTIKE